MKSSVLPRDEAYNAPSGCEAASQTDNLVRADVQFEYSTLECVDSLRLLLIQPAPGRGTDLQCNMAHTTLSGPLNFTALSYVWGAPSSRRSVLVDRKQVIIGLNLYDALVHLRGVKNPVLVWADAIMLNQSNLKERNHQVARMRDIYSKAEKQSSTLELTMVHSLCWLHGTFWRGSATMDSLPNKNHLHLAAILVM